MNEEQFVVELDESEYEQDKHIKISYKSLAWILASVAVLGLVMVGIFTTYLSMFWKYTNYETLAKNFESARNRIQALEKDKQHTTQQMNQLEDLAQGLSRQYGIDPSSVSDMKPMDEDDTSTTSLKESIQEFNILRAASFSHIFHHYAHQFHSQVQPSLWPVAGVLRSSFGQRSDPFSGEGAFHSGIDLSAAMGTPVHVTADGVVEFAGFSGRYGRLVIIDHGHSLQTYYAHLSQFLVVPGQEVNRNQVVALSGGSGRVTGPHLHYEVRLHGTPVNPYKYLGTISKTDQASSGSRSHNDLGL